MRAARCFGISDGGLWIAGNRDVGPSREQDKRSLFVLVAGSRKREQLEEPAAGAHGNARVSHCNKLCLHAARTGDSMRNRISLRVNSTLPA